MEDNVYYLAYIKANLKRNLIYSERRNIMLKTLL